MCNAVSAASGNAKSAWLLMLEVLEKTYEELAEHGMDTLWAKLRVMLKKIFTCQILNEIELEE